jgi:carboxylate-amine ligase
MPDNYSFGIEEEYFLVDAETKAVATTRPEAFFTAVKRAIGDQVTGEMLQSQIEVATLPHTDMASARTELKHMRQEVARIAAEHGLTILAAGTHPTAKWAMAQQSPGERYDAVMHDLQITGQRNMLCGLHVHVELPDREDRVDVMYRLLPYLPLFVALSTSSPFWQSRPTGMRGYRLAAYDELPRTGVPELFRKREEFDAYIEALTKADVIADSSYVWWALRPSLKHPTLELRAPDSCTNVDDSLAIAALYRSLARALCQNPLRNFNITAVTRAIVVENKWRAQRYGIHGTFAQADGSGATTVADALEAALEEAMPHAIELGCANELEHCRVIVGNGTSADHQIELFEAHARDGGCEDRALTAVNDWLVSTTVQ